MQDNVHLNPPPAVEMFGGQPPPTSWVNQNVASYLQIKSDIDFLTDLSNFARSLQDDILAKQRPPIAASALSPQTIPEDGTPEDVSKTSTYNALQPQVKEYIETMTSLVNLLLKSTSNSDQKIQLEAMLSQLKQVTKGFPNLSPTQMDHLGSMLRQMTDWIKSYPMNIQRNFWDQQMLMMQRMMQSLDSHVKDANNKIKNLEELTRVLQKLKRMKVSIQQLLANMPTKPLNPSQMDDLLAGLQTMSLAFSQLSSTPKDALVKYTQQLAMLGKKGDVSFPALLGTRLLQQWTTNYLKANPNASLEEVKGYLSKTYQESQLSTVTMPFMKEMAERIEDILEDKTLSVKGLHGKLPLVAQEGGKVVPSTEAVTRLSSALQVEQRATDEMGTSHTEITQTYDQTINRCYNVVEGLKQGVVEQKGMKENLGRGAVYGATQAGSAGSLPDWFKHALFNHYMPNEEAYLMELADILSFDNSLASAGNILLNDQLQFGSAQNELDFSNTLNKTNGNFSGSATQERADLAKEQQAVTSYLENLKNLLADINTQIQNIQNGKGTPAQKAEAISKLEAIKNNALASQTQLTQLQDQLNNIQINNIPNDPNHFSITPKNGDKDWQTHLSDAENYAINGNPILVYPGGLINVQTKTQDLQQFYSNQSQTAQMQTQLVMTETQQAMTLITSAMEKLFQAYMTIARAINAH